MNPFKSLIPLDRTVPVSIMTNPVSSPLSVTFLSAVMFLIVWASSMTLYSNRPRSPLGQSRQRGFWNFPWSTFDALKEGWLIASGSRGTEKQSGRCECGMARLPFHRSLPREIRRSYAYPVSDLKHIRAKIGLLLQGITRLCLVFSSQIPEEYSARCRKGFESVCSYCHNKLSVKKRRSDLERCEITTDRRSGIRFLRLKAQRQSRVVLVFELRGEDNRLHGFSQADW